MNWRILPTSKSPLVLAIASAAFFVGSWPAVGGIWPLIFLAFVPLFFLHLRAAQGDLSTEKATYISAFAFFLWNIGTINFLFLIDDLPGIRLLSLLSPVLMNTFLMTLTMYIFSRVVKVHGVFTGLSTFILCWLSMEWLQHHWSIAFPWLTLGNVLAIHPEWVQWYSYTGVAGGTLWILLSNALIFLTSLGIFRIAIPLLFLVLLPILTLIFPPVHEQNQVQKKQRFTIVQPCVQNADEKFDPEKQSKIIHRSVALLDSLTAPLGVIVFPETFLFEPAQVTGAPEKPVFSGLWIHNPEHSTSLQQLQHALQQKLTSGIITGALPRDYQQNNSSPTAEAESPYFNAALMMDSTGYSWRYKTMLVPGVEHIPFASFFPTLNEWALDFGGVVGSLGKQTEIQPVSIASCNAGVQICYDSAFGWVSTELARNGAQVQVIITNDSWWGDSPGYQQLFSFARLRAVETGNWVVRSANNGISAFISPQGEVIKSLSWNKTAAISADVPLNYEPTFYVIYGDYIYKSAALLLPFLLILLRIQQRRKAKSIRHSLK